MNKLLLSARISIFWLSGCEKESVVFYLDSVEKNKYYSEEIIPLVHRNFYGKWILRGISGGFSGSGYELDFDFLEVKPIGIYGLIRGDTINVDRKHLLQIKIDPDSYDFHFKRVK